MKLFLASVKLVWLTHQCLAQMTEMLLQTPLYKYGTNKIGWTVLHMACYYGNLLAVEEILSISAFSSKDGINRQDETGRTPLHLAASAGHLQVVNVLLATGADSLKKSKNSITPMEVALKKGHKEVSIAIRNHHTPELHLACLQGEVDKVKTLLAQRSGIFRTKPDLEFKDPEGNTPLCMGARGGHAGIIKDLLAEGAKIDTKCYGMKTALVIAAERRNLEMMEVLIQAGADLNAQFENQHTAAHLAADRDFTDVIKLLAKAGADMSAVCAGEGYTPLHIAAVHDHEKSVQALIDVGADINARDRDGQTPVHVAAHHGNHESIEILAKAKADLNAKCSFGLTAMRKAEIRSMNNAVEVLRFHTIKDEGQKSGLTALMSALTMGGPDAEGLARRLLDEAGEDVNARGPHGVFALQMAATSGQTFFVELLIGRGANVSMADDNGYTALHAAAQEGHVGVLQKLIDGGANMYARADKRQLTAAHCAAQTKKENTLRALLENGLDPNIQDSKGAPPLIYAVNKDCTACVDVLHTHKANLNFADSQGNTAIHYAAHRGNAEMVGGLLKGNITRDAKNQEGKTPYDLAKGHYEVTTKEKQDAATKYKAVMELLEGSSGASPQSASATESGSKAPEKMTMKELRKFIEPYAAKNPKVCSCCWCIVVLVYLCGNMLQEGV
jgi:ankyrin repeat protein